MGRLYRRAAVHHLTGRRRARPIPRSFPTASPTGPTGTASRAACRSALARHIISYAAVHQSPRTPWVYPRRTTTTSTATALRSRWSCRAASTRPWSSSTPSGITTARPCWPIWTWSGMFGACILIVQVHVGVKGFIRDIVTAAGISGAVISGEHAVRPASFHHCLQPLLFLDIHCPVPPRPHPL